MRPLILAAALVTAACGRPLLKLPSGAGMPLDAVQAASAMTEATAACQTIRTMTAEIGVSGSAAGHRLRGRLSAGVAAPASVRLEAIAPFGPPLFIFVAARSDATLLLPRDERVLEHGRPDAVLEAVAGVPLDAADLTMTLTGCAAGGPVAAARAYGGSWLRISQAADQDLYLRRDKDGAPWRLVSVVRRGAATSSSWRADYSDRESDVPRATRLVSIDADGRTGGAFDLSLGLSQIELNVPLDADVFTIDVPRAATPITLDELRASGPLAPR